MGIAALAARRYLHRPHAVPPELHHRDEGIAVCTVPPLRARIGARAERRERPPACRGERHRDAGARVVELWLDVSGEPLKPVDPTPWRAPRAEVAREPVRRG